MVCERRVASQLRQILAVLEPYREELTGIAVVSTFNWYWLVDGLMDAGFPLELVNTCTVKNYEGLRFSDDRHDARWLAHLMRLGLPYRPDTSIPGAASARPATASDALGPTARASSLRRATDEGHV